MGADNAIFLELLEWFDNTGETFVYRLLKHGSGEIKLSCTQPINTDDVLLPFWKVIADISMVNLKSYSDLINASYSATINSDKSVMPN